MNYRVGERVRMLPYGDETGLVVAAEHKERDPMPVLGETYSSYGVEYQVHREGQGYDVRMREEQLAPV